MIIVRIVIAVDHKYNYCSTHSSNYAESYDKAIYENDLTHLRRSSTDVI